MRIVAHAAVVCVIAALLARYFASSFRQDDSIEYPARPIKLVVPFNPGGGSDTFGRIMKAGIDDAGLLPQPLVIINRPGASATIGSRYVRDAKPDGYTLLLLHNAIITAKYSGQVNYGPEAFEPVAGTSEMGMVIAVKESAEYQSLTDLMDATRERPDEIVHGVNFGAPTHFAALGLEREVPGAKFRYTQAGDGADRVQKLVGGHIDVAGFSVSEYLAFQPQGIRALAFLGRDPHPAFPDVPTAVQQGINVIDVNMQFWWFPKGTPPDRIAYMANVLERAMQTEHVRQKLDEQKLDPKYVRGAELDRNLRERIEAIKAVGKQDKPDVPNVPAYVGWALGLCGIVIVVRSRRANENSERSPRQATPALRRIVALGACLTAYVLVMQTGVLSYAWATTAFLLSSGLLLAERRRAMAVVVVEVALLVAFGTHWLLTSVVVTDLP